MNTQFTFQPIYRNYQQTDSYKYDAQGQLVTALSADQIKANDELQANLRGIWEMGGDPKSAEARTKIAYLASAASGMPFNQAYKNSSAILKHYTGLRTDDISGWAAFADGIKQGYFQQMASLNQWMADHSEGEIVERYKENAKGFRQSARSMQDFQDRGAMAEWFIGASPIIQQIATQLAFTGVTAGVGGLVGAARGVAGGAKIGAQIAGWTGSAAIGMIESGSTSAEIDALAEEYGIEVDLDTKRKLSDAVGLVNMFLEHWQLSSMPGVKNLYRSGAKTAVDKAAKKSMKDILKTALKTYLVNGIAENTAQEVAQEMVSMLGVEAYKMASNQAGTNYDYAKGEEYWNRLWDTAKSSAAAFALTGGFGTLSEVVVDSARNTKVSSDANKLYQEGTPVNTHWIDTTGVQGKKLSKEEIQNIQKEKLPPVEVVEFRGGLKAVNPADAQKLADFQKSGIVGANVKKVTLETVQNIQAEQLTNEFATAFDARVSGTSVVFQNPQEMSSVVSGLVNRDANVYGVDVGETAVDLTYRLPNSTYTKITFTTEGFSEASAATTQVTIGSAGDNLFTRLFPRSSQVDLESQYMEREIAPKLKAVAPQLSDTDISATTQLISAVSRITGMTVDEFMDTQFSETPFVIRTEPRRAGEMASVMRDQEGRYTIHLTPDADVASVTHELAHVTRSLLSSDQLSDFEAIYGVRDGKWYERPVQSTDGKWIWNEKEFESKVEAFDAAAQFEEMFAEDFVKYLQTGQAPKAELQSFFETMKEALKNIVRYLKNYLSPETSAAFDKLFQNNRGSEKTTGYQDSAESLNEINSIGKASKRDISRFEKEVDSISEVVKRGHAQILHHTPSVLQSVGIPDMPVVMYRSKMKTILYDKEKGHVDSIDKKILKQLPDALQNPFLIFDSKSKGYVIVLDLLDIQGKPIVVALHPNEQTGRITANIVASAYGKSVDAIQRWIDKGLLRYQKKQAGIFSTLPVSRLQLPLEGSIPASSTRILSKENIVNNEDASDTELFELSNKAKKQQRQRNLDEIKKALISGYRVSDDILQEYQEDPDVQREIQYRQIISPEMIEVYRQVRDSVEDEKRASLKNANEGESAKLEWGSLDDFQMILSRLELMLNAEGLVDVDTSDTMSIDFIKRLDQEYALSSPAVADKSFLANYAKSDTDVLSFAQQLRTNGIVRGQMPPQMWALTIRSQNTSAQIAAVRKLIQENPRYFRKLLASIGDELQRQQLYYEQTLGLDEWVDKTNISRNADDLNLTYQDVQGEESFNLAVNRRLKGQTSKVVRLQGQIRNLKEVRNRQAVRQEMIQHARNISRKWNPNLASWYFPIGELLNQLIDPNFRSQKTIAKWQQEKGYTVEIPAELDGIVITDKDGTIRLHKPLNRWSLRELQVMDELVEGIRSRARQEETVRRNKVRIENDSFSTEYNNQALRHFNGEKPLINRDRQSKEYYKEIQKGAVIESIKTWFFTPRNMAWELDWQEEGVWKRLFDRLEVLANDESGEVHRRLDAWKAKQKELGISQKDLYDYVIKTPRGDHFTRSQAIGVWLNSVNKTNRQKLQGYVLNDKGEPVEIKGPGLTHGFTDADIKMIVSQLDPKYMELARWMKEEMGSARDAMAKVLAAEYNIPMHKVADYWPLVIMETEEAQQDMLTNNYGPSQRYANRSATHNRSPLSTYEINLDAIAVFENQIRKQEHFIHFAGVIKGMQYNLNKKTGNLYASLQRNHSKKYADWVQRYFNDLAAPNLVNTDMKGLFDKIRSNYAIAKLGFNVATVLRQTGAIWMFLGEFSPVDLMSASKEIMADFDGTTQRIYSLAPQMQDRVAERAFLDIKGIEGRTEYGRTMKKVGEMAMAPIQWADSYIANILWLGAYKSNMKNGMDSVAAGQAATDFIKRTQQTSTVLDADQLHRTNNQLIKWLTMFTTQGVKEFNMIWSDIPRYFKQKDYKRALGMMAGLGLNWVTMLAIGGALFPGDDEEEYWKNLMLAFAGEVSQSVIPVIGSDIAQGFDGYSFGSNEVIPGGDSLGLLVRQFVTGAEGEKKLKTLWNLGMSAGDLAGVPTTAAKRLRRIIETGNPTYIVNNEWGDALGEE